MSIEGNQFQFLAPVKASMSQVDLGIPMTPDDQKAVQPYQMLPGQKYRIFNKEKDAFSEYVVRNMSNGGPLTAQTVTLEETTFGTPLYLAHWQIAYIEARGQIHPTHVPSAIRDRTRLPGSSLILSEKDVDVAKRKMAYLDAVYRAIDKENFGKSSRKLIVRVLRSTAESRGEKAPSVTRFYLWKRQDEEERHFDRTLLHAPAIRKGNTKSPFGPRVQEMLKEACVSAYSLPKSTWYSVKARAMHLCQEDGAFPDLAYLFADKKKCGISDRKFQRSYELTLDQYSRDFLRLGPENAGRMHATYLRTVNPTKPLDIVDVDHTTLDMMVIDDEYPILFGRPDLIVFRDRHSGIVLGFALSFGAPRWDTFLEALRHAIFPKREEDLPEGVTWPWFGRPTKIGVDNAMHFLGKDIENASIQLGFQIVEYRPGNPWEKGALEHLFHITNNALVHQLPGSTAGSIKAKQSFDPEKQKAVPLLTMREAKGFLSYYFAKIHNHKPSQGLGDLVTLQGVPSALWEKGITTAAPREAVSEEIFVRLAGNTKRVCIHHYGIQWDYIQYQSHLLQGILLHPKHKTGSTYLATRDPNDLGHIWVHDPYNKRILQIPVIDANAKYAVGLTRYQHEQVVAYVRKQMKEALNAESLQKAMSSLQNQLMDYHTARLKAGVAHKMARFVAKQKTKVDWSKTIDIEPTKPGSGRMNVLGPSQAEPKPKRSFRAGAQMPGAANDLDGPNDMPPPKPEPEVPNAEHPVQQHDHRENRVTENIEAIRARSNWDD